MRLLGIVLILVSLPAMALDDLSASSRVSAKGMQLQSERLKVIAQNIANADTAARSPHEAPYSRKVIYVKRHYEPKYGAELTKIDKIARDHSEFRLKYEPGHPASNRDGYVKYPNVDPVLEMADAKEAQRSFEANLSALEIARSNQAKILEVLK